MDSHSTSSSPSSGQIGASDLTPNTPPPEFAVCVLLYGDYPELASRCLSKLRLLAESKAISLRIGMNAVSQRTEAVLIDLELEHCVFCKSQENIKKYPMMRRLFRASDSASDAVGVAAPFVMWFDDDSYISAPEPHEWLGLVKARMGRADMIGSIYTMHLRGQQASWVMRQPWYAGIPVPEQHRVSYCTGGWWTVRTEVLIKFQWPSPELLHRGGDVMLGELCRQQGLRLAHFKNGVAINADTDGRESKSPRRGFDSDPVGFK